MVTITPTLQRFKALSYIPLQKDMQNIGEPMVQ